MANSIIATNQQVSQSNPMGMEKYLTMNARNSLFAYNYSQVTKSAKHTVNVPFNEKVDFGRTVTAVLPFFGDLISGIHLYVKLPQLSLPTGSTFVGWTQAIAYSMIESIEVRFGETVIVRQPGNWLEVMDYLETSANKNTSRYASIGRFDTINVLKQNALGYMDLYLPFNMWFTNKKLSSSLPMLAMSGSSVKILIRFKNFDSVVTYDGDVSPTHIPIVEASLLVDYHILSEEEKISYFEIGQYGQKILSPLSYLIEQWQYMKYDINAGSTSSKFEMEFNKNIKEIVFYLIETESEDENNDYCNFGRRSSALRGGHFITNVSMQFDGRLRLEKLPESYYRLVTPQRYHSYAGNRNIYVISFAEFPELNNPSGTADFSAFDTKELCLDFVDGLPSCRLHMLGISYNRLTFADDGQQLEYV